MRRHLCWILSLLGGGVASAQPYQIQQGNVLDANPQYGTGGFNSPGRRFQPNAGNRIVSGNVTGGAAFRGVSPIADPSTFGLGTGSASFLPSDTLYSFRRDTYNVADVQSGVNLPYSKSPYYSTSSAVTNTGAIVGQLNRPGTSQVQTPYLTPRIDLRNVPANPLDQAAGLGGLSVSPRIERLDTGQAVAGPVNQRLLFSPLFGGVRAVPADVLAAQAAHSASLGAGMATPIDARLLPEAPIGQRAASERGAATPALLSGPSGPANLVAPESAVGPGNNRLPPTERLPDGGAAPRITSPAQAGDTFAGMQQMTGQLVQPLPTLADQAAARKAETHTLVRPLRPPTEEAPPAPSAAPAPVVRGPVQSGPLRTFVGTEQSALNRYLNQAEAAMRSGQFYRAEGFYGIARTIAPDNPLPLVGRSLALLAAGEYVSSADSLFRAIQIYEDLAQFPVDATAFVPDVKVLDRRRADLESRLEAREDHRLRFLLGYAEYMSGLNRLGLENMKKAADAAPPELGSLRRFVTSLQILSQQPATRFAPAPGAAMP